MKKIKTAFSAILAAAVILGTAASPAYAYKLKTENGVLYRCDDNSNQIGTYSGWYKNGGVERRYSKGKPYTGWLKYKGGKRKYCLDGYIVTGEMPIGKNICVFDGNGFLTKKTSAEIIVEQNGTVHSGDKTISVTAKPLGNGVYSMYPVSKLERWEKGKWTDCIGKDVEYVTCDCLYVLDAEGVLVQEKNPEEKIDFSPEEYMGRSITAGYYRITFPSSGGDKSYNVYAIVKVTD